MTSSHEVARQAVPKKLVHPRDKNVHFIPPSTTLLTKPTIMVDGRKLSLKLKQQSVDGGSMPKDLNDSGGEVRDSENDFVSIELPSGAPYTVYKDERDFAIKRGEQYVSENEFTHITDLQDLDRIIILELFIWRYGLWVMKGVNYWGDLVDEKELNNQIKNFSSEARQIKSALNLDRVSRDRQKGVDSPAEYIKNLGIRARAFGYKRNAEFNKMLELGQHLRALVTLSRNCDEDEQREMRCRPNDILDWVENVFFSEFDELDRAFRQDGDPDKGFKPQITWIRDM